MAVLPAGPHLATRRPCLSLDRLPAQRCQLLDRRPAHPARPCLQANRELLPALPDLSDLGGGLSNPAQFNFMSYILWKVRVSLFQGLVLPYSTFLSLLHVHSGVEAP